MRRKVLEGNCYIPNKLIRLLSNPQNNQSTNKVDNKRRVEKETVIRIENDILKKDGYDSMLVKTAVIWLSSGKIIFILEPTRAEIMQRKFELKTELKIYNNRNIFR